MKLFNFFHKKQPSKASSNFSRFFREASSRERAKVFKEAARKANEDQKKIFYSDSKEFRTN